MVSQSEISIRRVLVGHRAAVNVVDFDEKYIVSASGDRTIKVCCWVFSRRVLIVLFRFGIRQTANFFVRLVDINEALHACNIEIDW